VRNKISLLLLRITLAVVLVGGFALFGGAMGLYLGILNNSPELNMRLVHHGYRSSFIINAHTGEETARLHRGNNHESVTLNQVPLHVQNAFIAIEDERFWSHNGIDIRGIGRAAHTIVTTAGARTEGASTITQQLIKNMLDRFDSDVVTKLQEQYLAVNFERDLTEQFDGCHHSAKEFILESYLNIINLGRSNYGVQAAALFYYGVDVSELTIAQAATIASITQNPTRFPPDTRPAANWIRTQLVLDNMLRLEFITEEEHAEAMQTVEQEDGTIIGAVYDTIFRIEGGGTRPIISHFDCFTDALLVSVRDDLMREFGITREMADAQIFTQGLRIYSTQQMEKQAIVDRVFLDESYWPRSDFTIDIDYQLSLYNTITNQHRHYRAERVGLRNMDEVNTFVANFQRERMHESDEISNEVLLTTPQPQAAFVLMDHYTGHVLALRGVRGEKEHNRTFNRATQATRSPGSQFKPLATFAPAFELGILQPGSVVDDVPFVQGGWAPRNWWGSQFEGLSSARRAIYRSMNVVSVRATIAPGIQHVGLDTMFTFMQNFGFTTLVESDTLGGRTFTDKGGALPLGGTTDGVHLIELTGAYGAIANMGELNPPALYTMVLCHDGNILLENADNQHRILRDTTAYLLIDTMKDTMTASGSTGNQINFTNQELRRNIPVMGKTGTSQDSADLGFTGSTPYFTAGIWMGNDSNQRMSRNASGYHLRAWRSIMQELHLGLPARQFERPYGIVSRTICRDSGHLPSEHCAADPRGSRTRTEIFASQHVPTQTCRVHQRKTYCWASGQLQGYFCWSDTVVTRVGLVREVPIRDTSANVRDRQWEFPRGVLDGIVCNSCQHGTYTPGDWGLGEGQTSVQQPVDNWSPILTLPPIGSQQGTNPLPAVDSPPPTIAALTPGNQLGTIPQEVDNHAPIISLPPALPPQSNADYSQAVLDDSWFMPTDEIAVLDDSWFMPNE